MKLGKIVNLPAQIYLDLFDEPLADGEEINFNELKEVTWSKDGALRVGQKYQRSDLVIEKTNLQWHINQHIKVLERAAATYKKDKNFQESTIYQEKADTCKMILGLIDAS